MFSTQKIHKLLSRNKHTKRMYKSVYPSDRLPNYGLVTAQKPAIIIINLGESSSSGTHWVLLFFPASSAPAYYFDSFGRNILLPDLLRFVERNSRNGYTYNTLQVQHEKSNTCGLFVVTVAYLLARGMSPDKLTLFFSRDKKRNDRRVRELIKHVFT